MRPRFIGDIFIIIKSSSPKNEHCHNLPSCRFKPYFFLLWNNFDSEDIEKNVGSQTLLVPINFHCVVKNTIEVNGRRFVTNVLHNILYELE